MLAVHSASGYEEQGFSATLSLGSQGGTGPSPLRLPPLGRPRLRRRRRPLAGPGLQPLRGSTRSRAGPGRRRRRTRPRRRAPATHGAVDVRGGYCIRIPGNHLLTWSGSVNHSAMGPRFTTALQLGFGGSPRPPQGDPATSLAGRAHPASGPGVDGLLQPPSSRAR